MKAMTLFLALSLAGGAWGQTAVTTSATMIVWPKATAEETIIRQPRAILELIQALSFAEARIASLERQMAFLAWERRRKAIESDAYRNGWLLRERDGGTTDSERFWAQVDACVDKALGPCPPWPWSVPATKEATKP